MTRNQIHDDAPDTNMIKICDDDGVSPWSDLTHNVLLLVMMKLGVFDFLAFSRVCKSWRSFALSNKNKLIMSRPPMSISISTDTNEIKCYLEDFEGRKFKTIIPHSGGGPCIGVTCGYLIFFGKKSRDFLLVNPITRHELHFPRIPSDLFYCPIIIVRAIVVFSPSISRCVFVVFSRYYDELWFCIAGKREWTQLSTTSRIYDVIVFKGKVYTAHYVKESDEVRLCEMKLYRDPELVLFETESFPKPDFRRPRFVTSGENLYVIDRDSEHPYKIHEIDLDKMKWVSREKNGNKYTFFNNSSEYGNDISIYDGSYVVANKIGKGRTFYEQMWYFFFDCLYVDLIHK